MVKETAHEAAVAALVPDQQAYERAVAEVLERNERARRNLICVITAEAERQHVSKKALAEMAQLDYSFVRKVLTAEGANPTTQTALQLTDALGIRLEAVLESGERHTLAGSKSRPGVMRAEGGACQ